MKRKIVDFHAHAFHDKIAVKAADNLNQYYGIPLAANGQFQYLLESMQQEKIDKLVVHATATSAKQVEMINDYVAGLIGENIIGFGTLHEDYTETEKELDRIESLGLRGIKLHPVFQKFVMDDDSMFPIYKKIEGRFPILMHVGDKNTDAASPKRLAHLLKYFPKLTVVAAHMGGYMEWDDAEKYLLGTNVYVDTSSSIRFLPSERVLDMIRVHGADKVLFGTDYPLSLHKQELEIFDRIGLTEEESEQILWKNAYHLLRIEESK